MKIALKADNGLYVTAEEGGAIDTRDPNTPVALRARAVEIGPWETFDLVSLGHSQYALRTSGGQFVTAENGGGGALRTNETDIGVWENFSLTAGAPLPESIAYVGLFLTWDGYHVLSLAAGDDPILDACHALEPLRIEVLEAPRPPMPDRRTWRGSFCIPGALPGSPYGDGARIWTPAYGCYDNHWRAEMRKAYVARGYTHFVYNAAGLPYASDYPELADDPARVEADLTELLEAGLVPVVCCTDDRNPSVVLNSIAACRALIPAVFPVWEMNGPLHDDDIDVERDKCEEIILKVRDAVPDADCWLHFTPGHGAIGLPEDDAWRWCQDVAGTIGLLGQGGNKITNCDPIYEGRGFETTAVRLAGEVGYVVPDWDGGEVPLAWEGMHQLSIKFEWGIYESYHGHVTEAQLNAFTDAFLTVALHVNGFCDGGS